MGLLTLPVTLGTRSSVAEAPGGVAEHWARDGGEGLGEEGWGTGQGEAKGQSSASAWCWVRPDVGGWGG